MSGIEEDVAITPATTGSVILYWTWYTAMFSLFLAITAMGLKHGGNGVASLIATGLLWMLLETYPNRPRIET